MQALRGDGGTAPTHSQTPRPGRFTPGKDTRSGRMRKISPPPEIDSRTDQPVANRYTD
jgi:hypothetical protein